jgi:hypothetical protein
MYVLLASISNVEETRQKEEFWEDNTVTIKKEF